MPLDTGDTSFMLVATALVMIMTPGLAFFYGGLVSRKNVLAIMMQSYVSMGVSTILWVAVGYSLCFSGDVGGIIGNLDMAFLRGIEPTDLFGGVDGTIPLLLFVAYQMMFAIITPALITGAFAERMKFSAFVVFTTLWVTIVYAPVAHWVWADGGWLLGLGALDFAGGTVVHINSGVAALAAALILGPRLGFGRQAMEPHNLPLVVLGAGLLWFGWFGFNAGSALSAGGDAVNAFVVTNTAACAGIIGWVGMSWIFSKKPSIIGAASGAVAGLVAITPASGFVGAMPSIIIGIGAGVMCFGAIQLLIKLKVDDALSVWGVHGIGGTWGAIATGIFVGIGYGGLADGVTRLEQIGIQLIAIGATWAWAFAVTAIILLAIKFTIGLRVSESAEEIGLDLSEHGEPAYRL